MKLVFKPSKRKSNRLIFLKPIKLYTKQNVGKIPLKNLTWPQVEIRFPRMNPFSDKDKDGKLNMFDCKPFDKKKHSKLLRDEIANQLYIKDKYSKGAYKKLEKSTKQHVIPSSEDKLRRYISGGTWKGDWTKESIENIPKIDYRTHEGKSITEGIARKHYKLVTPIDVVKHVEKHPQLLESLRDANLKTITPITKERLRGGATITSQGKIYIGLSSSMQKDEDVGEILEHEIAHVEQGNKTIKKLHEQTSDWENRNKISNTEYENMPVEKDAEERRILKRKEWESWKEEQPETLQSLDSEEIKSIEIKDED